MVEVEPSLMVKNDEMILENLLLAKGRRRDPRKILEIKRTIKVLQHLMFRILFRKISMFRRNAPIDTK